MVRLINTTTNDTGNDLTGDFSNNYEDSVVESNNNSETINYNGAGSSGSNHGNVIHISSDNDGWGR